MSKSLKILIVDDHSMMRLVLSQGIQSQPDFNLAGTAANATEAVALCRKHRPEVVVTDYRLPGLSGVELTASLCQEFPEVRILLLSIFEGSEDIWRAIQAGAKGYLAKSVEIEEIFQAIRTVANGDSYFSAGLAEKLNTRDQSRTLSARELEVLREIVAGHSYKEIEIKLNLSKSAVKHYIENTFEKLEVSDRTQAATAAIRHGIIHLDE